MRKLAYGAAERCGVNRLARWAFRNRLLTVAYHGVSPERDERDAAGLHVPLDLFKCQVELLLRWYEPVSLQTVVQCIRSGTPFPERSVLITFDDGYRNFLTHALPWLDRCRVPCVLFPVVAETGGRPMMWQSLVRASCAAASDAGRVIRLLSRMPSDARVRWVRQNVKPGTVHPSANDEVMNWSELAEAAKCPRVEIGSHGMAHEPMTTLDGATLKRELVKSRLLLEERLGRDVVALAYPFGDTSPAVRGAVAATGYAIAFTTAPSHARIGDDALVMGRILVGAHDSPTQLASRTAGWLAAMRVLLRQASSERETSNVRVGQVQSPTAEDPAS